MLVIPHIISKIYLFFPNVHWKPWDKIFPLFMNRGGGDLEYEKILEFPSRVFRVIDLKGTLYPPELL